ncbi:MAG: hypothetical protein WCG95_00160 [bacterium]
MTRVCNQNSIYKTTAQVKWTQSAIECYQIGCICSNCSMNEIIGDRCRMKGAVIELVKTIGIPFEMEGYLDE